MSEEESQMATAQSCDYSDCAPMSRIRPATRCVSARSEDEDLDYPIPYSEEKAQQWAKEDPDFHIETYRQDSCFDKEAQAKLRRAIARVKAGKYVSVVCTNGKRTLVGA